MSFRRSANKKQQWDKFCRRNHDLLLDLPSLTIAFESADRFEELLQTGCTSRGGHEIRLEAMSDREWETFATFIESDSTEWQSWFVESLFPSYYRELRERGDSAQVRLISHPNRG